MNAGDARDPVAAIAYRPEVDGLRAVAVVPVVLFHADPARFGGGFLGVDIFFVISGFLITSIILKAMDEGGFTILNFYERRARRILPAFFTVAILSSLAAWQILMPLELEDFGRSLIAASLFYSNFYFYGETGYFATAAELQPMLHTWSLSVEEQFYIVYPPLLMFLVSRGMLLTWGLGLLALLSVTAAEITSRVNAEFSFFASHTRAFELLCGALVAVNREALLQWSPQLKRLLASAGFVGCLISFYLFSYDGLRHPGVVTLVPVVSTALVLAFAGQGSLPGRVLSWRPMVGIGLISYSLYLWHQPVFALYRVHQARALTDLEAVGLIAISFVLAVMSWALIERPFRRRSVVASRLIPRWAAAFVLLPVAAGYVFTHMKGFPQRLGDEVNGIYAQMQQEAGHRRRGIRLGRCHYNKNVVGLEQFLSEWNCLPEASAQEPSVKLLACCDSHAADKAWALRLVGVPIGNLGGAHCSLHPAANREGCREILQRALELGQSGRISGLVLAQRWDRGDFEPQALAEAKSFWRAAGVPVFIFTQMPEFERIKDKIARRTVRGELFETIGYDAARIKAGDPLIRRAFSDPPFVVMDLRQAFCGDDTHSCSAFADGRPLLIDYGHLSSLGARRLGQRIMSDPAWTTWFDGLRPVH